jgi:hypothetical protein
MAHTRPVVCHRLFVVWATENLSEYNESLMNHTFRLQEPKNIDVLGITISISLSKS